jgi:hypothetical protein
MSSDGAIKSNRSPGGIPIRAGGSLIVEFGAALPDGDPLTTNALPLAEFVVANLAKGALCVAKLASAPEIIDFLGRSLQFVDHFTGPNSR